MSKTSAHYVNNKEFTKAVFEYVKRLNEAQEIGAPEPQITTYIGDTIMKICNGLARKPNFSRYSYRDEMISDAIENCLRAVSNYDIKASTRSGNPNAYGYFTQIAYWAMVRRIQKEEKETEFRIKMITNSGLESFVSEGDTESINAAYDYVDSLKSSASDYAHNKEKSKTSHYGWTGPNRKTKLPKEEDDT